MGATAAIAAGGFLIKKANDYNKGQRKKEMAYSESLSKATQQALTPPALPMLPSTSDAATEAAKAMTAAANRVRRQKSGGYGSTILTSPTGAAGAPVARKSLLGL